MIETGHSSEWFPGARPLEHMSVFGIHVLKAWRTGVEILGSVVGVIRIPS
jgi:hypothetical protein